ncbi:MAG TPA: hypothetical protein VGJ20_11485 [Xanthobacteraceae bacterium]|jgi:hypothetical protein
MARALSINDRRAVEAALDAACVRARSAVDATLQALHSLGQEAHATQGPP